MSVDPTRSKRLKRLLKVQQQKRTLQEWRLATLQRERSDLDQQEVEIVESLGEQSILQGLFLDTKVRALRRNTQDKTRNAEAQHTTSKRLEAERRREKQVERAKAEAVREDAGVSAQKDLASALDTFLSRLR
ncbi:hypothetical protein [Mangrovicella endophytica]|uniref:hypothetical protein n=1 Tax=Mangrovicella endophytica TaxID=2066697 RepID=UPI000C9EC115|nr:hypothetical protein [Mangrovicella endophytica]